MYTQILGTHISQEGVNGIYTNYVYYTVLVVDDDGRRRIVEGQYNAVSQYFPYIRTSVDEIRELKQTVQALRSDIQEDVKYAVNSLFPIPPVVGTQETSAVEQIKAAGLTPVMKWNYPEGTPKNGTVKAVTRQPDNFKIVELDVRHQLPNVNGLPVEAAKEKLSQAGFSVSCTFVMDTTSDDGIALSCEQVGEVDKLRVHLTATERIPDTVGMQVDEASKILEAAGKTVEIKKQYASEPLGQVLRWVQVQELPHTVRLGVSSGTPQIKSRTVEVSWSEMIDSTGDKYEAEADLNRSTGRLTIRVKANAGVKTKHTISPNGLAILNKNIDQPGVGMSSVEIISLSARPLEAKSTTEFLVKIPWQGKPDDVVDQATVFVTTYYGITKKEDRVRLHFKFTW